MTRGEDLHTLCLSSDDDEAQDSQRRIRKAFLRLSRKHHPDKGGTNEGFRKLSEAYYRLREEEAQGQSDEQQEHDASDTAEERSDQGSSWQDYDYHHFWQEQFFNFFRQNSYQEHEHGDEEDDFYSWEQEAYERKKAWSNIHKQQLKAGVDFRDAKAKGSDACVFCGDNKPIKQKKAKQNGIEWDEYVESTRPRPGKEERYNTCWVCKTNHKSVMTEAMAKTKFAKKLNGSSIFQELRRAEYTFTAQPTTDLYENTRNSEYFWYPDLEAAALAAGWKPRGKQKEYVPWWPKNRRKMKAPTTPSTSVRTITPGSSTKRAKRRRSEEEDDRKPSAKRGLKF